MHNTNKNRWTLGVRGYEIRHEVHGLMEIDVSFVARIPGTAGPEMISEFLRRLGIWFAGGDVSIVRAGDRPRCFYCGDLNAADALSCRGCGASL